MNLPEPKSSGPASVSGAQKVRSFLENLTGPSRGQVHWLSEDRLVAHVHDSRHLLLAKPDDSVTEATPVASLQWENDAYVISAMEGQDVWVNGRKIGTVTLLHGDMIEFGADGPMSRYRLCEKAFPARWSLDDILSDALAYTRTSRRPLAPRLSVALRESGRRIVSQTTVFFRAAVVLSLCAIAVFGYLLHQKDRQFEALIKQDTRRIEAVALLLAETREEAISPADLSELRSLLEGRLTANANRLGALEERTQAPSRIIASAMTSVAFVQGAFGLKQKSSGKMLRHVISPDGVRLLNPFGQPRIDPEGTGQAAEFRFTGTGFLLAGGKQLVTNRHVALPWTSENKLQAFEAAGLEPVMLRLLVYFPDLTNPLEAHLERASDTADLAVLGIADAFPADRGLRLADHVPKVGEELYLLGYPTGLKALLAQAGRSFVKNLETTEETDFWTVAEKLSEADLIRPLASRGIVAQTSGNAIIYDAETTVGGSGGPALDRNGRVVAVNTAILPEFGGSNIGVPIAHLQMLLENLAGN